MPIYEYECEKCGCIEEALQKITDKPLRQCKQCSGKLHKLISHSAFHLKGTGWYVTDYAQKGKPPKADSGVTQSDTSDSKANKTKKNEKTTPKTD